MSTVATGESFVHPALFYRDEREYVAGTVPFVQEGLAAGEAVAVAVPGPNLEVIKNALGSGAEGVQFLDMTEAGRNPGRIIPGVLRAFADAHPEGHVRIIGEPIWAGRTATEYPACVQHEALINSAFQGRDATILCPYDTVRLDAEVIADAWATHPTVIDRGRELSSPSYDWQTVVTRYNEPLVRPAGAATVSFGAEELPAARHFAVKEAEVLGLPGGRAQDLALAVSELTTNSVIHGGGSGTLRIWAESERIVCEVEDGGRLADPLAGRRPAARGQLGGRGLLLVNYLADLVRVHTAPDGTTVRFYLSR
ncbi:sensor histidine kinase [Streptomyces sp. NPDC016459]|uniref:sensor histidine kinase n=1 Tax=Streptomyces sp. NPDC016459 TaxID=3157190 RepID=UPI0033D4B986